MRALTALAWCLSNPVSTTDGNKTCCGFGVELAEASTAPSLRVISAFCAASSPNCSCRASTLAEDQRHQRKGEKGKVRYHWASSATAIDELINCLWIRPLTLDTFFPGTTSVVTLGKSRYNNRVSHVSLTARSDRAHIRNSDSNCRAEWTIQSSIK